MGGYATWHSAMAVFAYPENHLLPELRPAEAQTAACKKLLSELRNHPRLGTAQARKLAAAYLLALTDELGEALPSALRHGALVITEQGLALLGRITARARAFEAEKLADMPAEDVAATRRVLRELASRGGG